MNSKIIFFFLAIGISLISIGAFTLGIEYYRRNQEISLKPYMLIAYDYDFNGWHRAIGLTFSNEIHWVKTRTAFIVYGIAPNGTDEIVLFADFSGNEVLGSTKPNADGTFLICYQKQGESIP